VRIEKRKRRRKERRVGYWSHIVVAPPACVVEK